MGFEREGYSPIHHMYETNTGFGYPNIQTLHIHTTILQAHMKKYPSLSLFNSHIHNNEGGEIYADFSFFYQDSDQGKEDRKNFIQYIRDTKNKLPADGYKENILYQSDDVMQKTKKGLINQLLKDNSPEELAN